MEDFHRRLMSVVINDPRELRSQAARFRALPVTVPSGFALYLYFYFYLRLTGDGIIKAALELLSLKSKVKIIRLVKTGMGRL